MTKIVNVNGIPVENPCTDVCFIDERFGWCLGCGRDLNEVSKWFELTQEERHAILLRIPRRFNKLMEEKRDWSNRNAN